MSPPAPNPRAEALLAELVAAVNRRMADRGINASQIARDAGVSKPTLTRLLRHGQGLSFDVICALAGACGLTISFGPADGADRRPLGRGCAR